MATADEACTIYLNDVWLRRPGVSTWLAHSTGQSFYDAVGTISVGALLGLTALFLVQKNRQLLLGEPLHLDRA